MTIGYHASHEQHPPGSLLRLAARAEEVGFGAVSSSDHLVPWSERQGHSGHAWTWLGAAMATTSVPFSVVTAPGQRYHPVVLAQAVATLGEMFPDRLTVALGSGEAVNEHVTGDRWPEKAARNARLRECADAMRALLAGQEVSVDGTIRIDRARLWSLPERPPALVAAALTEATARWCGGWADGLVTLDHPVDELRRVVDAFREGGGTGPVTVQAKVAYAATDEEALHAAWDQWRTNVFPSPVMADLETVGQFEAIAATVRPDDVRGAVFASSDLGRHRDRLHELLACGVDDLSIHQVPKEQDHFLDAFGEHVLPDLLRG